MKKILFYSLAVLLVLALVFLLRLWGLGRQSKLTIPALGVNNGKLFPCDSKPNCVVTGSSSPKHQIAPLQIFDPEPLSKIRNFLASQKRVRIMEDTPNYIRAEFSSAIFQFVDDVEFYWDGKKPTIEMRSASRVGYSDMGANRKRLEAIRAALR